MSIQHVELSSALRPELLPEELLLFVQDAIGLYEDKTPLISYQNGHVYLTSHRICYVDNEKPRERLLGIKLKDVVKHDFYAGFLKSSPKITLWLKQQNGSGEGTPVHGSTPSQSYGTSPRAGTPSNIVRAPVSGSWICNVCSFSNPLPASFDPSLVDASTPRPPCSNCGVKPPFPLLLKAAISAAAASRSDGSVAPNGSASGGGESEMELDMQNFLTEVPFLTDIPKGASRSKIFAKQACPVCTYENHPSMTSCEMCGTTLQAGPPIQMRLQSPEAPRGGSPGLGNPAASGNAKELSRNPESLKFSFRNGGEKVFLAKLREALIQRKWILKANTPHIPDRINNSASALMSGDRTPTRPSNLGIASLLAANEQKRLKTQSIIGDAFADLEHLMASAKEVIDLAESFQKVSQAQSASSPTAVSASSSSVDAATALALLGKDGSHATRAAAGTDSTYVTSLARTLAEFLADDVKGVLKREGGLISLADLWAVFNRVRGAGVELVSPQEMRDAVECFEKLKLPLRVRRYGGSGVIVVGGAEWSDERVQGRILGVIDAVGDGVLVEASMAEEEWEGLPAEGSGESADSKAEELKRRDREIELEALQAFGVGVSARELAEKLGWSVGVAEEELGKAEERGAVCREMRVEGVKWWRNHFLREKF